MKQHSRWLAPLGLLAVGFLAGRYTAEPQGDVVRVGEASTSADLIAVEPISVELNDDGSEVEASAVDPAAELSASPNDSTLSTPRIMSDVTKRCVGTWTAQTSHGPRLSTLDADGTGVIHAELDWMAALLYGRKMTLHVDWVIDDENNIMIHTVTSGEPTENVAALLRDFGSVKEYQINELTEDAMVLVDPGDGEVITWQRTDADTKL